ncbi:YrdB family protein [Streptomyces sp. YIM 98790]|uniref:YrdB family protein n=1 Tax=Streptomyces sp. YIM 98790 TaxID=2689077 RepID=UPI00140D6B68|nr:YrdB family protein [Streptomyces sp. YIM 98790]
MTDRPDPMARLSGNPLVAANELLAFVVEMMAFGILAWAGYEWADGGFPGVLLGAALLAGAITLWGLFAAPRARFQAGAAAVLAVKAVVLLGSAAALFSVGSTAFAVVYTVVVVLNTAVLETFRRRS